MNKRLLITLGLLTLGIFLIQTQVIAQPGVATCQPLVQQALDQLGDNCDSLDRNNVCYGFSLIQASLADEALAFEVPRDRAEIGLVTSLRTSPLDENEDTWGIAVLNTQANLPGTLPGQGVIMMLLGETELVDAVDPSTLSTIDPVDATINAPDGARIRTGAGFAFNVLAVIEDGEAVSVDGRSEDGQWLRLVAGDRTGWMFTDLLTLPADMSADTLPVVEDLIQSPMQAVYFRSGVGAANCEEAPDALVVQSPQGTRVNLTINEAEVTIGSTIVIETLENNTMVLYVVDGTAEVNGLVIPQGYKATVPLEEVDGVLRALEDAGVQIFSADGDNSGGGEGGEGDGEDGDNNGENGSNTGGWGDCSSITEQDRVWLNTLTNIPSNILSYSIQPAPAPTGICASPEEIATIQQQQIIQQQQSQNGQNGVNPTGIVNGVDCTGLQGTSPTGGMNWGQQTFWFDPASGASAHRVDVLDENGTVIASEVAQSPATNALVETGVQDETGGVNYTWIVTALDANGSDVCSSDPISVPRGAAPESYLNRDVIDESTPELPAPVPVEEEEEECYECEECYFECEECFNEGPIFECEEEECLYGWG
jgi:hypothetical protein